MDRHIAVTFVWILLLCLQTIAEEAPAAPVLYGSDEKLGYILGSGGHRTWLDNNVKLPAGTIISLVAYIADLSEVADAGPLAVRFQVWTVNDDEYVLKWEKRVEVTRGNDLLTVDLKEEELVDVTSKDMIGFTSEQQVCPISYNYTADYNLLYEKFKTNNGLPVLGETYTNVFTKDFTYPAKFAFGVYIGTPQFGKLVYAGNPLVETAPPEDDGNKAWIDTSLILPTGLLEKFQFQAAQPQGTNAKVLAQVWFPCNATECNDRQFTLLWEREISVDRGQGKYMVTIPSHESIVVNSSCRLGWTFPGSESPIYFLFDSQHFTQYYQLPADDGGGDSGDLKIGDTYQFDISFPRRFSVGVWIDTAQSVVPTLPTSPYSPPDTQTVPPNTGESNNAPTCTGCMTAILMTLIIGHTL